MTLLLFLSCSRQQKTTLIISRGASVEVSQNGGIMIWGYHFDTGQSMAISLKGEYAKEIELETGEWEFFAVGWSGTNSMEGSNRCAFESVVLLGARETLSLTLKKSTCSNGDFSDSAYIDSDNQFKKFQLIDCASKSNLSGVSSAEDSSCEQASSKAGSFRLVFYEVLESDITGNGLESECQIFDGPISTTGLLIPTGNSAYNSFYTSIEVYSDDSCNDNFQLFSYLNGLIESESYEPDQSKFFANSSNASSLTNLFISYTAGPAAAEEEPVAEEESVAEENGGEEEVGENIEVENIGEVEEEGGEQGEYNNTFSLVFYTYPEVGPPFDSPLYSGDNIQSAGISGQSDFSISFWVKMNVTRNDFLELNDPENAAMVILEQSGAFDITLDEDGSDVTLCLDLINQFESIDTVVDENNLFDKQWHHIVFIRKSNLGNTEIYLYVDNVESSTIFEAVDPTSLNLEEIVIASQFQGGLDEVSIWNNALTSEEVQAIYNNGVPINLTENSGDYISSGSLNAFWNFNSDQGVYTPDAAISFIDSAQGFAAASDDGKYPPSQRTDVPPSSEYMNMKSLYFAPDINAPGIINIDDFAYSLNNDQTEPLTISAWIRTSSSDYQVIIAQTNNESMETSRNGYYELAMRNGNITWEIYDDPDFAFEGNDVNYPGALTSENVNLTDNIWHHIVIVREGDRSNNLYIDGDFNVGLTELEPGFFGPDQFTLYNDLLPSIGGDAGAFLRGDQFSDLRLFDGYIDEVSIWQTNLDSDAIVSLYNNQSPIDVTQSSGDYSPANLFAHWSFDNHDKPFYEIVGSNNFSDCIDNCDSIQNLLLVPPYPADDQGDDDDDDDNGGMNEIYSNTLSLLFDNYYDAATAGYIISGDNAESPGISGQGDFSVSFWVKMNIKINDFLALNDVMVFLEQYDGIGTELSLWVVDDGPNVNLYFYTDGPETEEMNFELTEVNFFDNQWHHIVATRSFDSNATETTMHLYLDNSHEIQTFSNTPNDLGLGEIQLGNYLQGAIDEFAIWNTTLSSDEVSEIYNGGTPMDLTLDTGDYASSQSLNVFWNFEDNQRPHDAGTTISFEDEKDVEGADLFTASSVEFIPPPGQREDTPNNPEYMNLRSLLFDSENNSSTWDLLEMGTDDGDLPAPVSLAADEEDQITISAWIKTSSLEYQIIIAQADWTNITGGSPGDGHYKLAVREGYITWDLQDNEEGYAFVLAEPYFAGEHILKSTDPIDDNEWHHVVIVREGDGTNNLYIDGNLDNQATLVENDCNDCNIELNNLMVVSIGGDSGLFWNNSTYSDSHFFQGYIDEVSIWETNLDANAIASLYNNGVPIDVTEEKGDYSEAKTNFLFAHWSFDHQGHPYRTKDEQHEGVILTQDVPENLAEVPYPESENEDP